MNHSAFKGTPQEQEAVFKFLWELSADGFFVCDSRSGKLCCCNQTFLKLLDRTALARTDHLWDIVPKKAHSRLRERIDQAADRPSSISLPDIFTVLPENTAPFEAEILISGTTYQGEPAVQGILRKMTDSICLRRKYRQAQKREIMGISSGGIAHEFNNLIQTISGYTDLLMYTPGLTDSVRKKLVSIQKAARRAADLTREFMSFNQPVETRYRKQNKP